MKLFKIASIVIILAMVFAVASPSPVQAQAYATSFATSITYQNVGTGSATISISFYAEADSDPVVFSPAALAKGASTSLYIGNVGDLQPGFRGSAVMASSQPLVTTLVQLPQNSATVKNRPMSNGFGGGSDSVQIPTALKGRFGSNTIFTIQNVDSVGADLTVQIYNADNPTAAPITSTVTNLPSGAAKYYDMGTMTTVPGNFNGSVKVTAKKTGTSTAGAIVGSAMELSVATPAVSAFEGVSTGTNTVYMPSAICNAFGGQNTSYAVQNNGGAVATVTVTYSNGNATPATAIAAGAKKSFAACDVNANGFSGSAVITSTGSTIVAMGKVYGTGLSTAFVGATAGGRYIALPYVRYTQTQFLTGVRQRAFIAVQNVSTSPVSGVVVKYIDYKGTLIGTHSLATIPAKGKLSSNPSMIGAAGNEFGYYGSIFGGGAVIEGPAGAQLVAIVRVQSFVPATGQYTGEDYSGTVITTSPAP